MSPLGRLGVMWGLLGTAALLLEGVVRLWGQVQALQVDALAPHQLAALAGWCAVMAIAEGYRGFQRHFIPRVVARAWHLGRHPRVLHVALAPLFCMGLVHATRRRLVGAWGLLLGIVALVLVVRTLPQPWRGIVDAGVVVGLSWGLAALAGFIGVALRRGPPTVSLDLPAGDEAQPALAVPVAPPASAE
jgi:hypothetical protein